MLNIDAIKTQIDTLADRLQESDFGTELTLNLDNGAIGQTNRLGVESYLHASSIGGGKWEVDYTHTPLSTLSMIGDVLYEPANYMDGHALRWELPEIDSDFAKDHDSITAMLAVVDSYDCDDCEDGEMSEYCDHTIGWALIWSLRSRA